jgi:hypothetical protein
VFAELDERLRPGVCWGEEWRSVSATGSEGGRGSLCALVVGTEEVRRADHNDEMGES